ncbi:hypothetical protein [Pontibacter akesuensis]|uniref:Uncharacterized protein n=1 Tax=Pontibacter akesuensis TaxID=388950 RepID=A0A1I7FGI9_9BACT|nr:hypothetical protein [Pontibacter akesuensis]GHA62263.1 hypothetical protein GCM10007389_13700 [Pontibacter akesuensis]SFU35333.1 hypothetical protein SAMN04487941_0186 [Pontibacter akesuensis]
MGFFDKLFGKPQTQQEEKSKNNEPEHAVIVRFDYGIEKLEPLHALEDKLEEVIGEEGVGEYDGHEIAVDYSDGFLYMYGPNAEILFKTVKPVLTEADFMKGAKATLRFGPPEDGVKEVEVEI